MEPHAPISDIPPPPQLDSPFLPSSPEHRGRVPSLNLDTSTKSSVRADSRDSEISSTATPPPPATHDTAIAYTSTLISPGRETSPDRLSTISGRSGSQLQRSSSQMGFMGDKGAAAPQRGAAALFGSLFSKPAEQQHPTVATATATNLLPVQTQRTRSGSNLSTISTPKSSTKGFFTTLGSAIQTQLSPASPPGSSHMYSPEIGSTLLIDEFAGISFGELIRSYALEPTDTPETPEEAQKQTPEARLAELSATAADLLERVYTAYQSRTASLATLLASHADTTELLDESRSRTTQYKLQLERLATDEQDARDEQNFRITVQDRRIKQLESALQAERTKREEAEEELRRSADRERKKRTSAASDSGFESDGDSLFSRDRASMVVSPVESFLDGGADEHAPRHPLSRCDSCTRLVPSSSSASSIRNPTPLSQAWSPGSDGSGEKTPTQTPVSSPPSATTTTATKWGFGSLTRKAVWSGGGVAEEVRSENRALRARVGELERVVDDCLEFVAGRERIRP